MKKSIAICGFAGTVLLAGCSSTSEPAGPSASTSASHEQVLKTYFDAFATQKSSSMAPMLNASAPASPAHVYAQHQINLAVAYEAANSTKSPDLVTIDAEKVTMKSDLSADATEQQKAAATNVYKDFTYGPDGLIQTWTTDPGGPLAPRVSTQSASATKKRVTVTLRTAYLTNGGDMFVTYDARNSGAKKVSVYASGYVNPDGRQVKTASPGGSLELQPGAFATDAVTITSAKPSGTLIFQIDYQTTIKVRVS